MKAKEKNLARDPDFYRKMGRKGGKNGNTGGFASLAVGDDGLTGPERAKIAGARGGRISRRKPVDVLQEAIIKEQSVPTHISVSYNDHPHNVSVRVKSKRSIFAEIRRMFS